jgi:hypothetical protein
LSYSMPRGQLGSIKPRDTRAEVEQWQAANWDKFWNPERGLYFGPDESAEADINSPDFLTDAVSVELPSDDVLDQIEKSLDKPNEYRQT